MKWSFTLQNRLLIAFLLVALVPLGLLSLSNQLTTRRALEGTANQALFAVASQAATNLDNFVETTLRTTGTEAHLPAIVTYMRMTPQERVDSAEEMAVIDLLDVLSLKNDQISSYALLDTDGVVVYDTQADSIGRDESAESWFTFFDTESLGAQLPDAGGSRTLHGVRLRDHDIYMSPVELSDVTDSASIYFSSPVHDIGGSYFGLLRVRFEAAILQDLLVEKNDQAGPGSFGVLFDEWNVHLAHGIEPDVNFIPIIKMEDDVVAELIRVKRLPDLPNDQLFPMQLDDLQHSLEQSDTVRFFEAEDVATGDLMNQVAVAEMTTQPWKIAFFQPQEIFLGPIRAQTRQTIVLATIISAAVAVLGLWMASRLAKPIKELTRVAKAVSAGDLTVRADVVAEDEIGTLANAFNAMTVELENHVDSLEQRVEARTQELNLSNSELQDQRDFAQQVLSSMGQGLAVMNRGGHITYSNPVLDRLSGYNEGELLGKTPWELFYEDEHDTIDLMQQALIHAGDTARELRIQRPSGELIWVLANVTPRLRDGKIIGAIGVITDLTVFKEAARDLALARDQALESSRLKSEFLATMSHEIRTPMNGIIGMSDFLLKSNLDKEQIEYASIVQSEANSLLTIINDILDFSKVEAGKLVIDTIDFDIRLMAERTVEIMKPKATAKRLPLQLFVDPKIKRYVHGDEGRVKQILTNLVGNAVKFTQSGRVMIQIRLKERRESADVIMFEVIDTGIGILADALKTLFQPFVQADGSITRRHGGTGLGLAISKRLVELMDGQLGVDTESGKGSTFWFTLPFAHAEIGDDVDSAESLPLANTRALLIADAAAPINFLPQVFRSWGAAIDIASTRDEVDARWQAGEASYDVVLVDLAVRSVNPLVLPAELHQLQSAAAPLLLINPDENAQGDYGRTIGYRGVLQKPVRQSTLYNMLLDVLAKGASAERLPDETESLSSDVSAEASAAAVVVPPEPAPTAPPPPAPVEPLQSPRTHVLLVEDYPINRKVALKQLDKLGYSADVATNGQEAIEILLRKRADFALVLMDIQMPVMDGLTATREIRRRQSEIGAYIPIVAMTANAIKGDLEKCLEAGMDDYISKPVRTKELEARLKKWSALAGAAPV